MMKSATQSFTAILERENSGLGWTIIRIPFDAAKAWKMRGRVKVRGEINGFEFRTTLFSDGKGGHTLLVNKKMQTGAAAVAGMSAKFRLEPDTAAREVNVPPELKKFLAEDRALRDWFGKMSFSIRKFLSEQIADVKNPETRRRRAEQTAELLLATMEGERELPPILRAAFARDPRTRKGWEMMSQLQRRGHLMGIFYYKSPESRGKRLAKAMQQAAEIAEKKTKHRSSE
nr:YdeI/OmpD-associated family protein [Candidatus Acidoferrales bacterium]